MEVSETAEGLTLAVEWVAGKVDNQIHFLNELAKRRPNDTNSLDSASESLTTMREKLQATEGSVDEQRGTVMGYRLRLAPRQTQKDQF